MASLSAKNIAQASLNYSEIRMSEVRRSKRMEGETVMADWKAKDWSLYCHWAHSQSGEKNNAVFNISVPSHLSKSAFFYSSFNFDSRSTDLW